MIERQSVMTLAAKSSAAPLRSEALQAEVDRLRQELRAVEAEKEALEKEVVRRGVKLSCANVALARAKIAFDQAAERREDMVLEVSHDLRTPLTSIKGAAQNLLDGVAGTISAEQREYVEIVREHAERLIGSVNWLVETIRVTAAPIELTARPRDLADLAAAVVRGLGPLAEEAQIRITLQAETAVARIDEERFRKVVENLVGNALKFTPTGGLITVRTLVEQGRAVLSVGDTGPGLRPDEVERVFDRFYRGRTDAQGSGVGLAISREIVRAHGGDLTVACGEGRGCTFQAWLPLDGGDPEPR